MRQLVREKALTSDVSGEYSPSPKAMSFPWVKARALRGRRRVCGGLESRS